MRKVKKVLLVLLLALLVSLLPVSCGGGGVHKISDHSGFFPTWSPDGQKIAFLYYNGISTMNADGSDETEVLDSVMGIGGLAWSPDGTRIAVAWNAGIWTCAPDGSNFAPVVLLSYSDKLWGVSWSPDGSRIAFARPVPGEGWDIYVVDADGGNEVRLTSEETDDYAPSWSPSGGKIAFHSATEFGGRWDVYVMNADGSERTRLTDDGPGNNCAPVWSPDGSRMAFISWSANEESQIYLMDANGGNVARLIETSIRVSPYGLAWSPDGTRIAFSGASKSDNNYIYVVDVP